jgi:hypothetical protein
MSAFPSKSLETLSGTITAWLPLPTPFISIAACSSQIYKIPAREPFVAFEPSFTTAIIPGALQCLPLEVASSWEAKNTETTTVLGPTFVCPAAYSGVQTVTVNPSTTQTICCPK